MPHHSHKIAAYRDSQNVWASFCEWCGCDDDNLEHECNRRYHGGFLFDRKVQETIDSMMTYDNLGKLKSGE